MSGTVAAVHGEWIKLRSVRSPWILVTIGVFVTMLLAGLSANAFSGDERPVRVVAGSSTLMMVLLVVLGVQVVAQEYRFGTIRTTFTAVPLRWRVVVAKVVVGGAVGAVTGLLALAGSVLVAGIVLSGTGYSLPVDGRVLDTAVSFVLVGAVAVVLGIGIGAITRNPALGITLALVWMFVVEPAISAFAGDDVARWLPLVNGFSAVPHTATLSGAFAPWYLAAGLFVGWTVLFVAIGGMIIDRRDA